MKLSLAFSVVVASLSNVFVAVQAEDAIPSNCAALGHKVYCKITAENGWEAGRAATESSTFECPAGHTVTGRMATFATSEETAWALDPSGPFNSLFSGGAWIGGLRQADGSWEWLYGLGTVDTPSEEWAPGEPSNVSGEDCLNIVDPDGIPGWNDGLCGWPNPDSFAEYDCTPIGGGGSGDPHFKKWNSEWYDFHGICDQVMISSPSFAESLGLDIHVRTKPRYQYSYIEATAIKIGSDVLEVGSWGQYWVNGVENVELPKVLANKFVLEKTMETHKIHHFVITLNEETNESITIKVMKDMVNVNVENASMANFGTSVGMLGSFPLGTMLARDGATILEDANLFGQEWQAMDSDPQLFLATANPYQPVAGVCVPREIAEDKKVGRRLGGSAIAMEAAEKACAHHKDQKMMDMCIMDVLAMNDLDVADIHGAF